jgi:hypothetical protein
MNFPPIGKDFFHRMVPPIFIMAAARKPRDKNGAIGRVNCDALCGSSFLSFLIA